MADNSTALDTTMRILLSSPYWPFFTFDERLEFLRLAKKIWEQKNESLTVEESNFIRCMARRHSTMKMLKPSLDFLQEQLLTNEEVRTLLAIGKQRATVEYGATFFAWPILVWNATVVAHYHCGMRLKIFYGIFSTVSAAFFCLAMGRYGMGNALYPINVLADRLCILEAETILRDQLRAKRPRNFSFWSTPGWDFFFGHGIFGDSVHYHRQRDSLAWTQAYEIARRRDTALFATAQAPWLAVSWRWIPSFMKSSRRAKLATVCMYGLVVAGRYKLECDKGTKQRRIAHHAEQIWCDVTYRGYSPSSWSPAGWKVFAFPPLYPTLPYKYQWG